MNISDAEPKVQEQTWYNSVLDCGLHPPSLIIESTF